MKNSLKYNSLGIAFKENDGTARILPLTQSAQFDFPYDRVAHKSLGPDSYDDYYVYKNPEISVNLEYLSSSHFSFASKISRNNIAYSSGAYNVGDIVDYPITGMKSALYDIKKKEDVDLKIYSMIQDSGVSEITGSGTYSGFFVKCEDVYLNSVSMNASVGQVLRTSAEFSVKNCTMERDAFAYESIINDESGRFDLVRPNDIVASVTGYGFTGEFAIESFDLSLPISYKDIEVFGDDGISDKKVLLPVIGSLNMSSTPSGFQEMYSGWYDQVDQNLHITIYLRQKKTMTSDVEDYMAIKINNAKLQNESVNMAISDNTSDSISFSFLECGKIGGSGIYFIRKVPDSLYSFGG